MNNKKMVLLSIINSLGVLAYISLVVLFMSNTQRIFGKGDNPIIGVVMLLIFILSALITGSLVLGRPILFYLEGKKAEGVRLLLYTIIDLAVLLALVILAYLGLK